MRLQFLRGGCVLVETGGVQVLMDPWLTDGEYYGSWAHYPPFEWDVDFSGLDYIYVSHIHPDHFSAATMRRLPKVPVLIHKFQAPFLRANIEALGFEAIELPHATRFFLGTPSVGRRASITIFAADDCDPQVCARFFGCAAGVAGTQLDTMCVLEGPSSASGQAGKVLLNVNDCPYQLSRAMLPKLRTQYPQIDLLLVAYAGAGPYPQCFTMPDEEKKKHARMKKGMFIGHVRRFAEGVGAKVTFPFAGDYLLQGKLSALNRFRGVPEFAEVISYLTDMGVPTLTLAAGASWTVGDELPPMKPVDLMLRQNHIDNVLRPRKLDYEDDPAPAGPEIRSLLIEAAARFHAKREEVGFASATAMYIDTGYGLGRIPLDRTAAPSFEIKPRDEPFILLQTDPRLLHRILRGPKHAHWNNAEIGSHVTFTRRPDRFERGIHQIVSYLHA